MPMNFIFGNYNKISGTTHVKAIKSHDVPNWLLYGNNLGYLLWLSKELSITKFRYPFLTTHFRIQTCN